MPARSLSRSVTCLLDRFRGCFITPTFETFCALVVSRSEGDRRNPPIMRNDALEETLKPSRAGRPQRFFLPAVIAPMARASASHSPIVTTIEVT